MTTPSREDVLNLLKRHKFEYQRVPLPHGLEIKGKNRRPLMRQLFPEDFKGKSVLDIGCCLGYFCLAAKQRGAGHCDGIEANSKIYQQAVDIRNTLGADIELHNRFFKGWQRSADYVLCFNILHHVLEPVQMLAELVQLTRHTLLLEYVTPLNAKYKHTVSSGMMKQPLIAVGNGTKVGDVLTFAFTPAAIEKILTRHLKAPGKITHGMSPESDRRWLKWERSSPIMGTA